MVGGLFGYILVRGAIGLTITDTTNQLALLAIVVIAAAGLYVLLWFGKKKTDDPYKSVHPLFDRTISIIALVAVVMLLVQVYITSFR